MKSYIGTKIVKGTRMSDEEFNAEKQVFNTAKIRVDRYKSGEDLLRGEVMVDGCNSDPKIPQDGYKVMYEDGYISWSPKEVFERCYREITEAEKSLIK